MGPGAFRGFIVAAAVGLATGSCSSANPVHRDQVDALGGEASGVPQGPLHRAGQPCTMCHGVDGPASTQFVLAGTVFSAPDKTVGLDQAEILLVDSLGSSPPPGSVVTNCVGNFYVTADQWNPAFPIRVAVASGGSGALMTSHIGRAGSCASCHSDPKGLDSAGHVYVAVGSATGNPNCPVSPVLAGGNAR
jgi:hypothetical protein